MLELDLLLQGFLEKAYARLSESQQRTFCRILEYPDQLLLDWLMAKVIPADPEVRDLVQRIRSTSQD
jgi:antitoxin CptB